MPAARRKSIRVELSSIDVDEQRREFERFMQEKSDRELAVRMEQEGRQRRTNRSPSVEIDMERTSGIGNVLNDQRNRPPTAQRGSEVFTSGFVRIREHVSPPPREPVQTAQRRHNARRDDEASDGNRVRPPPRAASAAHPTPGPIRTSIRRANRITAARNSPPGTSSVSASPAELIFAEMFPSRVEISVLRNARVIRGDESSDLSDTVSSDSDVGTSPGGIQPLVGNDREMYARELHLLPMDSDYEGQGPSTSSPPSQPARRGVPDTRWGECTMCFEFPIDPQGCHGCLQIIGCRSCVYNWFNASSHPSCPLCRRKWNRQPDVVKMSAIERRRRIRSRVTTAPVTNTRHMVN